MEIFKLVGSIFVDAEQANESLAKTDKAAENTGKKFGDMIKTAGKIAVGVGAAVATGAAAMYKLAESSAATSDEIDKMSQKLGISREAYQELDFILSQSGADVESFQSGMKNLLANMDKVNEGNKTATSNFEKLGISVTNADGSLRDQEDVLYDTIAAFQGMEDGAEKTRLAQELFGKQGQELMPLLNSEAGSLEEMRQQAHDLGLVLSDETIDAGVQLTDTIDQAKRSFGSIATKVGTSVMPVINDFLQMIIANMPTIQNVMQTAFNVISAVVEYFAGIINNVAGIIAEVRARADELKPSVDALTEAWDAVTSALKPVIDFLGKVIDKIKGTSTQSDKATGIIKLLTSGINGLAGMLNKTASVINSFVSRVRTIITVCKTTLSNVKSFASGVKSQFDSVANKISAVISKVKSILTNWKINLPHIKMPHFKISPSGWEIGDLLKGKIPSLSIDWYKKAMDNAMVLDSATIFGMNGDGQLMGGGEAGSEVISGEDHLIGLINSAVASNNKAVVEAINELTRAVKSGNLTQVELVGEADGLFKVMQKKSSNYKKRTGREAFA